MESKNYLNNDQKILTINVSNVTSIPKKNTITEKDKANDPDNYILNPETGRYIKRDSAKGKKLFLVIILLLEV